MIRPAGLAGLALLCAAPAHATLPPALDGSWYNPLQSGHGITLERIDAGRALLFWHVFDPVGNPLTLYIETRVEGDKLVGQALAPSGMRFGRFDEADLELPFWGSLHVEFTDCLRATLRYDSPLAGFGRGEIPLTRLVAPTPADCTLDDPAGLASMAGQLAEARISGAYVEPVRDVQDRYTGDARGWVTPDGGLALASQAFGAPYSSEEFALFGVPTDAAGGEAKLMFETYANGWLLSYLEDVDTQRVPANSTDAFELRMRTHPGRARGFLLPRQEGPGVPEGGFEVKAPPSPFMSILPAGTYRFRYSYPRGEFGSARQSMELVVGADQGLCVRRRDPGSQTTPACLFTGRATRSSTGFEFQLQGLFGAPFVGVGQARTCPPPQTPGCEVEVTLLGHDGHTGLRIVATPFGDI